MITLFSGIPGSGKSYKMVSDLVKVKDKFFVVHNIDGLAPGFLGEYGLDFIEYCASGVSFFDPDVRKEPLEVIDFFTKDFQIEFCRLIEEKYNRPVLVIIDEAQEWLSSISKGVKMWLSYHRHLAQDIWLVAHRAANIPAVYRSFIEIEYRAKSGSIIGIPGFFLYNRIIGGQRAGYCKEKKHQEVFAVYKSQESGIDRKRKMPLMFPMIAVFIVICISLFFYLPSKIGGHFKSTKVSASTVATVPVADVINGRASVVVTGGALPSGVSPGVISDISDRYAFVGSCDGAVVVEDRRTGASLPLSRVPGGWMPVEISGLESCSVLSRITSVMVILYNSDRFADRGESVQRSPRSANGGLNI